MRNNLPVTDDEYVLDDGTLIVSKTDVKGRLTYFNEQFVKASGFSEQELMGQPHNIVRHPDMPPEAFQNLWDTLKAGRPWVGAVKNRRKNGSFYWVLASATPLWENGQVTGYMSVRTKLPADQRAEAEHVYALLRNNKAHGYKIDDGIIRRRSWFGRLGMFTRTLRLRLTTMVAVQAVIMMIIGAAGIFAVHNMDQRLQSVYEDRAVPLGQLTAINERLLDDAMALRGAVVRAKVGKQIRDVAGRIAANRERSDQLFADYTATRLTAGEKAVADAFSAARQAYFDEVVGPGVGMVAAREFDRLGELMTGRAEDLFRAAKTELDKLVALQVQGARDEYSSGQREYVTMLAISITLLLIGLFLGVLNGVFTTRAITVPLRRLNTVKS